MNKSVTNIISLVLVAILSVNCTAEPQEIAVANVSFTESSIEITEGETHQLTAIISPEDATDKTIKWSSSNTLVASVDNKGIVKATQEGTTTISASAGGKTASCQVTVRSKVIPVISVSLNFEKISLTVGSTQVLTANIEPANATNRNVSWQSSDDLIASVENGKITATAPGTALITATTEDGGKSASCAVSVVVPVSNITLNSTKLTLEEGQIFNLIATIEPSNATNNSVTWSSSNTSIATIENGLVIALAVGDATIRASIDNICAECYLSVIERTKTPESNEIWYTSTDGAVISISPIYNNVYKLDGNELVKLTMISNTYESGLGKLTYDGEISQIGESLFAEKSTLEKVYLPNSVNYIGPKAFMRCSNLVEVRFPERLDSIGNHSFVDCALSDISFPDGFKSIGTAAFGGNSKLKKVILPESVEYIGSSAFYNTGLEGIILPNSVSYIGSYAFSQCKIKTITLPSSLKTIEGALFAKTPLEAVVIPNSIISIKNAAFDGCPLESLTIPTSVTEIGDAAFRLCNLSTIVIPDSVTSLGKSVFESCFSLRNATLPNTLKQINDAAFRNCYNLTQVSIPSTVESIGWYAFEMTGLDSIEIRGACTSLGVCAFNNCQSLISVALSGSISSIGRECFANCTNLVSVNISASLKKLAGSDIFSNCTSLESVILPDTIEEIGVRCFSTCSNLSSIYLGKSLKSIQKYAFDRCTKLVSVTIPDSISYIGEHAFSGCSAMNDYHIKATTPPRLGNSDAFVGEYGFAIYVPNESLEVYKSEYLWSNLLEHLLGE